MNWLGRRLRPIRLDYDWRYCRRLYWRSGGCRKRSAATNYATHPGFDTALRMVGGLAALTLNLYGLSKLVAAIRADPRCLTLLDNKPQNRCNNRVYNGLRTLLNAQARGCTAASTRICLTNAPVSPDPSRFADADSFALSDLTNLSPVPLDRSVGHQWDDTYTLMRRIFQSPSAITRFVASRFRTW